MSESFSIHDLGKTIAKMLGLAKGDTVELARSKIDANQVLIIKHSSKKHGRSEESK